MNVTPHAASEPRICAGCGAPIRRDWIPTDPTLEHYHGACRPGAGRLPRGWDESATGPTDAPRPAVVGAAAETCCLCPEPATQRTAGQVYFPFCAAHWQEIAG